MERVKVDVRVRYAIATFLFLVPTLDLAFSTREFVIPLSTRGFDCTRHHVWSTLWTCDTVGDLVESSKSRNEMVWTGWTPLTLSICVPALNEVGLLLN